MKLHRLTVENLNSLYGQQSIDFDESLSSAPLFLIVGQTGAGKSTLLDAICLALFGQTPRLQGKKKGTGDPVEILSYGEGACRSILEFSKLTPQGRQRYKAEWKLHLSHGKPGGRPQPPRRSLDRWDPKTEKWSPLVANSNVQREYQPHFDEVLEGIHVEDFLRSVLLAQGQFTRFLKASEDKKSEMLEKLTGTERYTTYGKRAKQKFREVDARYKELLQKMEGFGLHDDAPLEELLAQQRLVEEEAHRSKHSLELWTGREQWEKDRHAARESVAENTKRLANAEQRLQTFQPQLQRLERHRECSRGREPLLARGRLQEEQDKLHLTLLGLKTKERTLQKQWEERVAASTESKQRLEEATARHQALRPLLAQAIANRTRFHASSVALRESQERFDKATQAQLDATKQRENAKQRLQEQQQALERLQSRAALHAHRRPLLQHWAEWRSLLAQLQEHQKAKKARLVEQSQALSACEGSLRALAKEESTSEEKQRELDLITAQVATDTAELRPWLEEGEEEAHVLERLTSRREEIKQRGLEFKSAKEAWDSFVLHEQDCAGALRKLSEEENLLQGLHQRSVAADEAKAAAEEAAQAFAPKLRHAHLSYELVKERRQLQEGDPCPLCHSHEHGFRSHPDLGDFEREIEETYVETERQHRDIEARVKTLQEEVTKLRTEQTSLERQAQESRKRFEKLTRRRDDAASRLHGMLDNLGIEQTPLGELSGEWFEQRLKSQRERWTAADNRAKEWQTLQNRLQERQTKLQNVRTAWERHTQTLQHLSQIKDNDQAQLRKKEEALRFEEQTYATALESLEDAVQQVELEFDRDPEGEVHVARTLKRWEALFQELQAETERVRELQEQLQRLALEVNNAEAQEKQREQQRADLENTHKQNTSEHAAAERTLNDSYEKLGSRDLDPMESHMQQEAQRLQEGVEEARKRQDHSNEEKQEHNQKTAVASERIGQVTKELSQREIELKGLLRDLALVSLEELEDALLSEEQVAELEDGYQKHQKDLALQQRLLQESEDALGALEREPPALPEGDESESWTLEVLKVRVEQERQSFEEKLYQQGQIKEKVTRQREQNERFEKMQREKHALESEHKLWQEMDKLIGVGDGRAFRKFAQALNLRQIAEGANAILRDMAPRYRLSVEVKDRFPTLNFVVRDHHHANAERSLSTLSGGETFLVSLALALSLAELHARDLRIESLLLDEGFGTLDPETLELALATLGRISAKSSQQIGIISHVEALKEKVEHKVVVQKRGNGRSTLSVQVSR